MTYAASIIYTNHAHHSLNRVSKRTFKRYVVMCISNSSLNVTAVMFQYVIHTICRIQDEIGARQFLDKSND